MFNQTQSSDLESENNHTFTQQWSGWREKQITHQKSKQKKQTNPVFKPCVFKVLMIKCKIYGTFSEIRYSMTLKKGVDFGGPFKRSSGLWPNAWKNASKDFLNIFLFWSRMVFAWVFPTTEIHLQRIPGKTEKKGELVFFLGAHKGDKPLEFLSKGLYYISLLLN